MYKWDPFHYYRLKSYETLLMFAMELKLVILLYCKPLYIITILSVQFAQHCKQILKHLYYWQCDVYLWNISISIGIPI